MDEHQLRRELVGRRIAARRTKLGLSQRALAGRIGASQGAISAWEQGNRVPRWTELHDLAEAIEAPAAWIIEPMVQNWSELSPQPFHDTGEDI